MRTSIWQLLARSRKFWLAFVAVVQTLLFTCAPNFPAEIWQSINVLLGVLIAAIVIEDVGAKLGGWKPISVDGVLRSLSRSRKFWFAVVGITQTVLFCFLPSFPEAVWQSVNMLLEVVIIAIAIEDAAKKFSTGV